jgi:ABC-2 type transport system ATP-binding protein
MLHATGLKKRFKHTIALEDISLNIDKGEFYGLLGPNGAGKTTMINILSSVMKPDEGAIKVNGYDIKHDNTKYKMSIGSVPQEIALYDELNAYENLLFWGGLYHIPQQKLKSRALELLQLMGLKDRQFERIKNYSGGMKRRVNIAASLLHDPQLLFLDEPTVGIDPQSRNLIFDVLKDLHQCGMTIIYTTHYMEEAEKLCNRIGIIDHGKIIAEGTLNELKNIHNGLDTLTITTTILTDSDQKVIRELLGESVSFHQNCVSFRIKNTNDGLQELIRQWTKLRLPIHKLSMKEVSLETIFLNLTGHSLRD